MFLSYFPLGSLVIGWSLSGKSLSPVTFTYNLVCHNYLDWSQQHSKGQQCLRYIPQGLQEASQAVVTAPEPCPSSCLARLSHTQLQVLLLSFLGVSNSAVLTLNPLFSLQHTWVTCRFYSGPAPLTVQRTTSQLSPSVLFPPQRSPARLFFLVCSPPVTLSLLGF